MEDGGLVLIEWRDSAGVADVVWHAKDDWQCHVVSNTTIGKLVDERDDSYVVAQSWNEDQWGRLFAIPQENVTRITLLQPAL